MKRLLLTYLGCIAVAFSLPVLIGIGPVPEKTAEEQSILPKEINVYFHKEQAVRTIGFEEYIKGVLPAEMPALFEGEALKAQAVAARTFTYHKCIESAKNPSSEHPDAAVCTNSLHCSAYYSHDELLQMHGQEWMDEHYEKMRSYVDATKGEILTYDNEPILAVFHSASAGGYTQSSGDVWGKNLPYLVSVESKGEEQKSNFISTAMVSSDEFKSIIQSQFKDAVFGPDISKWIGEAKRTNSGNVLFIEIGGIAIKGTQIRSMFSLKSTHFDIAIDNDNIIFTVAGNGHGVGMSQYGANYMAKNGADYKEILKNYYKGSRLMKYP